MPQAAHVVPQVDIKETDRISRVEDRRTVALDDAKRSFLRMVSHELRTPLNSILGFSEIISSELYGPLGAPQYKEYAQIIRSSGQRLLNLVNQVLEIARLEGHVTDLDLAPESIDHAIDDVLMNLREEIAGRGAQIIVQDQGDLPAVVADARGLRTVLTNLLENAILFGPEGGEVRIEAQVREGWVNISVIDHGEGIDPGDAHRLLKPFEQGENALVRSAEGAGLGLPIADLMCQAMGGRLTLQPAETGGLRAVVRLPAG